MPEPIAVGAEAGERVGQPASAPSGRLDSSKLKVFISYARADKSFTDELVTALEHSGFEVLIDRESITGGDAWERRLRDLILGADTVVFVLSPSSTNSEMCEKEVAWAVGWSKRILPVVCSPVDFSGRVPSQLQERHAIHMDGMQAMSGLARLIEALNTDLDWLKQHTRLAGQAQDWHLAGQSEDRLLLGTPLLEARQWLQRRPRNAPPATDLQQRFIAASDEAEIVRTGNQRLFKELLAERAAKEEAQRLAAIEQAAKENAQKAEAEAAFREADAARRSARRGRQFAVSMAALAFVALAGSGFAYLQLLEAAAQRTLALDAQEVAMRQRSEAEAQQQRAQEAREEAALQADRLEKLVRLTSGTEAGRRSMVATCRETISVVSTLAATSDLEARQKAQARFWELYNNAMYIVETFQWSVSRRKPSTIEAAMVGFGKGLEAAEQPDTDRHALLCPLARSVRAECTAFFDSQLKITIDSPDPCPNKLK